MREIHIKINEINTEQSAPIEHLKYGKQKVNRTWDVTSEACSWTLRLFELPFTILDELTDQCLYVNIRLNWIKSKMCSELLPLGQFCEFKHFELVQK